MLVLLIFAVPRVFKLVLRFLNMYETSVKCLTAVFIVSCMKLLQTPNQLVWKEINLQEYIASYRKKVCWLSETKKLTD